MPSSANTELIEQFDNDRFLHKFVPGTTNGIRILRAKIAMLNSGPNLRLVHNVLICGESGSGKNYIAGVLAAHRQWLIARTKTEDDDKVRRPLKAYLDGFQEVSLPGLGDELIESELFGHKKGAFTGAVVDHPGYFGEGYTDILLDEIGDASARLQAKLLRVLNSGQYRPVGGTREDETATEARLMMATHQPLATLVEAGGFRPDLLWRIREFVLFVPPLREQKENLQALADRIVTGLYEQIASGLRSQPWLTEDDIIFIRSHSWPGNIRQLRHALTRWLIYGGARPLKMIIQETEGESTQLQRAESTDALLEAAIKRELENARANAKPAATNVGAYVKGYESRVKSSMAEWLEQSRPSPKELETMFPTASGANSIRTQIRKVKHT